ncbi:type II toxin-antitoxin system Phd/YefM family antitoxin [Streptomyces xiamenensis]|uniref:type II toxin-antitoxin system Phd/YefM family antitoxin n=1 Tax=Streptomyces xiamenensis TaxID=408015 RepID=UPI0037D6B16E
MSDSEVHMGVSEARANLTEVIAKVRLLGERVVLTRRDKAQAVLVSNEFYEQALGDKTFAEITREAVDRLDPAAREQFDTAFGQATADFTQRRLKSS